MQDEKDTKQISDTQDKQQCRFCHGNICILSDCRCMKSVDINIICSSYQKKD